MESWDSELLNSQATFPFLQLTSKEHPECMWFISWSPFDTGRFCHSKALFQLVFLTAMPLHSFEEHHQPAIILHQKCFKFIIIQPYHSLLIRAVQRRDLQWHIHNRMCKQSKLFLVLLGGCIILGKNYRSSKDPFGLGIWNPIQFSWFSTPKVVI